MQLLSEIYCNNFRLLSGEEIYYLKSFCNIFAYFQCGTATCASMAQVAQIEKCDNSAEESANA